MQRACLPNYPDRTVVYRIERRKHSAHSHSARDATSIAGLRPLPPSIPATHSAHSRPPLLHSPRDPPPPSLLSQTSGNLKPPRQGETPCTPPLKLNLAATALLLALATSATGCATPPTSAPSSTLGLPGNGDAGSLSAGPDSGGAQDSQGALDSEGPSSTQDSQFLDTAPASDLGAELASDGLDAEVGADKVCEGALLCDDGLPCTVDSCDPNSGCIHSFQASAPCSDGNACTSGDNCASGSCGGTAVKCDDQSPCTKDSCNSMSGCVHTAVAGPCDDGDSCTSGDACKAGVCANTGAVACNDGLACTKDSCDSKLGCVAVPLPEGATCDDGAPCTIGSACDGGKFCVLGTAKLWTQEFGGPANTSFVDATPTADGGFAVVGNSEPGGGVPAVVHLYRFGPTGALLWKNPLASWVTEIAADTVLGGFWTATYTSGPGGTKAVVSRLDSIGKTIWSKNVGLDATSALSLYDADGGVVVVGTRKAANANYPSPWAARLDAQGNLVWEATVDMGAAGQFGGGLRTADGLHVWAGGFAGDGKKLVCLAAANSQGKIIWKKELGQDGNYGFAQAIGLGHPESTVVVVGDGFILQADLSGQVQWQNTKGLTGAAHLLRRPGLGTLAYGTAGWASMFDVNGNFAGQIQATNTPAPTVAAILPAGDGLFLVGTVYTKNKELHGWTARADAWGQTSCIVSGVCADAEQSKCDDANPCTKDVCTGPKQGCQQTSFPDGTPCTAGKACKSGKCI